MAVLPPAALWTCARRGVLQQALQTALAAGGQHQQRLLWPAQLHQLHHEQQHLPLQHTRAFSSSSSLFNPTGGQSEPHHSWSHRPELHGTTVLCVRKDNQVVLIADGQITAGPKVVKPNARKLRRLATEPQPSLGGFAGSTADGLTLFERLEQRLEEHPGQLRRAAVELAKAWRQDRILRHLEAVMIVADASTCLEVSGKGELLEPADGVHAIGSGARFAVAAARALMTTALPPLEIAQRAMAISAARCVYTNSNWVWEVITAEGQLESGSSSGSNSSSSNGGGKGSGGDGLSSSSGGSRSSAGGADGSSSSSSSGS